MKLVLGNWHLNARNWHFKCRHLTVIKLTPGHAIYLHSNLVYLNLIILVTMPTMSTIPTMPYSLIVLRNFELTRNDLN